MSAPATRVPIEHNQIVHQVRTTRSSEGRVDASVHPGSAASRTPRRAPTRTRRNAAGQYTLLELVDAIADVTEDDREIVATVLHLLASGQVRLCGNFRDEPVELILAG